jgi:hypothetical protein
MGGYFNTSQPTRLTVPKDGIYVVLANLRSTAVWGGYKATELKKNNSVVYSEFLDNRASNWVSNPFMLDEAVAGDYYEVQVYTWANDYSIDVIYLAKQSPYFYIVRVG